jgi:hypothetical protein
MKIKYFNFKNFNLYLSLVYFFWIILVISYFFLIGIKYGVDTYTYIMRTEKILSGDFSIIASASGFGLSLLLLPFVYFDISLVFFVFFNILLTGLAGLCLYKITSKFFCKLSGIICVVLFLFYFPFLFFNFQILTDTLFINLIIICCYLFVYFKKIYIPIILLLILALISVRPNGLIFLFSILICTFFFLISYKKYLYLLLFSLFSLILIFPIINISNNFIISLNLQEAISSNGIILGYSFEKGTSCWKDCSAIELTNQNYENNIIGVLKFISINFINYFKLFLLKIFWLLLRARPYYSDLHNLYIIFFDIILYPSFIYGFIKRPKNNFSVNVILFFILFSIILVGLTFDDWDGRFSLYFLSLVMIFSSYGILIFVKKFFYKIN